MPWVPCSAILHLTAVRWALALNLELGWQLASPTTLLFLPCPPAVSAGVTGTDTPVFYVGAGRLNSDVQQVLKKKKKKNS